VSLRGFHVVFVTVSALLCLGLTAWGVENGAPAMAVVASAGGLALAAYGRWFLRRTRGLGGAGI
jgi:hypothetical protein